MQWNCSRRSVGSISAAALGLVLASAALAAGGAKTVGTTYPVVDTNQTLCYGTGRNVNLRSCPGRGDDLYGQDAHYTINPPRYRDNGDGTVTDLTTGLMWQKGFTRNVVWSQAPGLARQANTGGHTDWRVPSTKELYSLIDFSGHQGTGNPSSRSVPRDARPFIDTRFFGFEYPTATRYIDAQYVTTTTYTGIAMGNAAFFGVNFADGRIKGYPQQPRRRGDAWYARFVRGNPDYGRNVFKDGGDGTVTDTATGLAWMQGDSGHRRFAAHLGRNHYKDGRMDWPEALRFCENLAFAGGDDWRLPNAKELQSLVDYTRSPQATRTAALDPVFDVSPISDEAGRLNYPGYWSSSTLLAGRTPGSDGIVVYFGEALGAPSQMGGAGGGGSGGAGQGMQRQGMQQQGMQRQGMQQQGMQGQGFPPPHMQQQGMQQQGMQRQGMQQQGMQGQGFPPPHMQQQGMQRQGMQQQGMQGQGFPPPHMQQQGMQQQGMQRQGMQQQGMQRQGMQQQGMQGQGFPPPHMQQQGMQQQGMQRQGMQQQGMQGQGFPPPHMQQQGMQQQGMQRQGMQQQGMQQQGMQGSSGSGGGGSGGTIMDVHGAGAQRSDPKTGDAGSYPTWGHGPQGDVRRVYNYVRCARTAG